MRVPYLSYSRISTFDQCQGQYHAVYDLDIKEKPEDIHPVTLMGRAGHKMFQVATNAMRSGRREPLWDPMTCMEAACRQNAVAEDLKPLLADLTQAAKDWGYFRHIERIVGCEVPFHLEVADDIWIKGFIDRLDLWKDQADIVDLKFGKWLPAEFDGWQARIYNVAVRRLFPQVTGKVQVSFWYLRHRVERVYLTASDAEQDEVRLVEKAREILAIENPTFSVSALCPWCPYKDECPEQGKSRKQRYKDKYR